MLRSLYSGISGLRAHQAMLDVTGNNIANVNTTAFKASAAQFQDTLSQMSQAASGPQTTVGGTNPAQVGLGVQVAGISTNFAQGSAQTTGRSTDIMISGDGFFVTQLGGETLYTRAGAFDFDAQGRLVSPDGAIVQGWNAVGGVINAGGGTGNIALPVAAVLPAEATGKATVIGNLPADAAAGTALVRDIEVFDGSGTARTASLSFVKSASANEWTVSDVNDPANQSTLAFDTEGKLTSGGNLTLTATGQADVAVDLNALQGFSGLTTVAISDQDGAAAGTLDSFTLGSDGTLVGLFSNGGQQAIGRIALATFTNPGGLEKAGASGYRATFNSGTAALGTPGSSGVGSLQSGALEMSNVDLSQEFTNLIVAQRGFQANARIITTSDEVLQELTNLKR